MDGSVLYQVFHEVAYGAVLLDPAGRIVLWNRWMEDRSRRAASQVCGKTLPAVFPDQKLSSRLLAMLEKGCKGEIRAGRSAAFKPHPLPLRDPAEPRHWLVHSLSVSTLRGKRGGRYCLVEVHDRSRAHTRERMLRHATKELRTVNEKLRCKNQELDEFVHQVSHDLQEPLRKLISFSQLLKNDLGQELEETVEQDLFYIGDSATRMSSLVDDLLRLSRAGNEAMQCVELDPADCVSEALEALSLRLEETQAEVEFDSMPTIVADRRLLTQLYQNLASNALKFQRESQPPRLHFTCEEIGEELVFGVRDNGIGIEPDQVEAIFAPFKRLHDRTTFEGTGIGLSVCQTVARRHGGRIWVESELGSGAHFRFTLAAREQARIAVPAAGVRARL